MTAAVATPAPVMVQITGTATLTIDGVAVQAPFVGTFAMPAAQINFTADSTATVDSTEKAD
jgi:hypothetical protein